MFAPAGRRCGVPALCLEKSSRDYMTRRRASGAPGLTGLLGNHDQVRACWRQPRGHARARRSPRVCLLDLAGNAELYVGDRRVASPALAESHPDDVRDPFRRTLPGESASAATAAATPMQ